MKIEGGRIKPCSNCLKARQKLSKMILHRTGLRLVEMTNGDITISLDTNLITATSRDDWHSYIGTRVYLAGRNVIDVDKAAPITSLGTIVKVSPVV
jgi:hypothetical protein